jgi:hypothetical protein
MVSEESSMLHSITWVNGRTIDSTERVSSMISKEMSKKVFGSKITSWVKMAKEINLRGKVKMLSRKKRKRTAQRTRTMTGKHQKQKSDRL